MKEDTCQKLERLQHEAVDVWFVFTGNNMDPHGAFASIEEALTHVSRHIVRGAGFRPEIKDDDMGDEQTALPYSSITSLSWHCTMRKMTQDEIRAHKSIYEKDWLKNPPNTDDFEAARRAGVRFVSNETSSVNIVRGSRYAGYLLRAGRLNEVEDRFGYFEKELQSLRTRQSSLCQPNEHATTGT